MGCARKTSVATLAALLATLLLVFILLSNPYAQNPSSVRKASDFSKQQNVPLSQSETAWSGLLTHRDAKHVPSEGGQSPFFSWGKEGGVLQAQRAYWEHLVGRTLKGSRRRELLWDAVQNLPVNGSLETGNYFVTMQLGTPPQNITLLLDSGSSLLWVECNNCADCTGLTQESPFQPGLSSTVTTPNCNRCPDYNYGLCSGSPYVSDPSTLDSCFSLCAANKKQCYYGYSYGDGSQTGGYIQTDVITVPSVNSPPVRSNVTFGCNYLAADPNNPYTTQLVVGPGISGLVGLSKGNYSLQNQLARAGVSQSAFSVCLAGIVGGGLFTLGNSSRVVPGMQYIPMGTHPEFYNVTLAGISVGADPLDVSPDVFFLQEESNAFGRPDPYFLPDAIFDTGTSFTILPDEVYTALAQAIVDKAPQLNAPVYIDALGYIVEAAAPVMSTSAPAPDPQLPPAGPRGSNQSAPTQVCFNVPEMVGRPNRVDVSGFPNVTFSFVNSAVLLTVPPRDYMFVYAATDRRGRNPAVLACPTFISDGGQGTTILGEYTMRNHFIMFDTQAARIGVAPVNCSTYK